MCVCLSVCVFVCERLEIPEHINRCQRKKNSEDEEEEGEEGGFEEREGESVW